MTENKIGSSDDIHSMSAEGGGDKVGGAGDGAWFRIAPFAAIALSLFFASMWICAVVVNGDWTLGEDTLSELGGAGPSEWIFNLAVIVSGLIGIFFAIGFDARLRSLKTGRIGCTALAIASVFLISVGVFPIDTGLPHGVVSVLFFTTAALAAMLLLRPIFKWVGPRGVPFIATVAALATSFASLALTPLPFAEAVAVASLLAWSLVIGAWMLSERIR